MRQWTFQQITTQSTPRLADIDDAVDVRDPGRIADADGHFDVGIVGVTDELQAPARG